MTHLAIDADSLIYKACCTSVYTVYDIYPLTCTPEEGTEFVEEDNWHLKIKTFRYVKDYKGWLTENGKTVENFYRDSRTVTDLVSHAITSLHHSLLKLQKRFQPEQVTVHLTGSNGFRYQAARFAGYKANRIGKPKPIYYQACKDYLIEHWDAKVEEHYEADDKVAMELMASNYTEDHCILVSIDKDLDTVPGLHYNIDTNNLYNVSVEDALIKFYGQLLTGDSGDNIKGVRGWSPNNKRKLAAFFNEYSHSDEEGMYQGVLQEYIKQYGYTEGVANKDADKIGYVLLRENADLLYMQHGVGDSWLPPNEREVQQ